MTKTTLRLLRILDAEKEKLFQYASYRLRNIDDVEDVLQNLYVKILENPAKFDCVVNKRAYLYRIVSNQCSDISKRNANVDFPGDGAFPDLAIGSLEVENFDEEFRMINHLLAILPEDQSEAIRLRHHSQLSFQEIADIMEIPLPTAKARYRYGIEKLRDILRKLNIL